MPSGVHNVYCPAQVGLQKWKLDPAWFGTRDLERFWAKVDHRGPDACWLWTSNLAGGKPGLEYGQFSIAHPDGTPRKRLNPYAHRVAWILAHGPIPDGLEVCHSCDVARCCNVAHMRLGTRTDNMRDAQKRGRLHVPRPSRQKLTPEQLEEIDVLLMLGVKQVDIARYYGVSKTWVCLYAKGNRRQFDRPAKPRKVRAA